MAVNNAYWVETLTGGGEGALDAIDHLNTDPEGFAATGIKTILATDDICIVASSTQSPITYYYDSTDANAEDSPDRVKPDSVGAGNGAWNRIKPETGFLEIDTFEDGDLAAGALTITHSLGQKYVSVKIFDDNGEEVNYDSHIPTNTTTTVVSIASIQAAEGGSIPGTWTRKVTL